ncbi:DUF389 domain-containing protein [Psychrobacter okhotskensis]|uniref:DUF389 domain-containing protein n=1 Tax=Psychrobacter okhotskensis TaxID=212403 RepID=UPI00191AD266|nr:DUF389 domain-containing protein [Psychrobacter okhotskensis]
MTLSNKQSAVESATTKDALDQIDAQQVSESIANNNATDEANVDEMSCPNDKIQTHKTLDNETLNNENPSNTESDIEKDGIEQNNIEENDLGAQPLEAKVKMESLGPDVVVASIETSVPETQTSADMEKTEVGASNADDVEKQGTENSQKILVNEATVEAEATDDSRALADTDNRALTDTGNTVDDEYTADETNPKTDEIMSVQGTSAENIIEPETPVGKGKTQPKAKALTATENEAKNEPSKDDVLKEMPNDKAENNDKEEEKEDEVKEQKEAKLESYKQFVAEQFSNQKVDYPEVRVRIEANALPSKMYFIMNILSAVIASYGLVTNSAAVVIGAMLVAMMLGPITGIALAIIDHRMPLLRKSLITVIVGVSLVVLVGFVVGWLHKDQPLTTEILSRTQPTSMDLMIALAGGTAGAYAMVSPHLSVAVVGVAVATALVPPLAASGILFANGEIQLGFGALLLAVTNIIAIQFTNALVLWLLGFRRLVKDDYKSNTYLTFLQRNAVTLLLLAGLGTYLTINLQTNAKQQVFESSVKEAINSYFIDKGNVLTNTQFDTSKENKVVRAVIRGETTPTSYDVRQIETVITQDMAENFPEYLPIKLQLRYLPVQVIESNPLIQDKLDKTDAAILTN